MTLRAHMRRSGEWLFRHRSYLPLLLLIPFLVSLRGFQFPEGGRSLDRLWEGLCFSVSLLGLGVRVFTVGYAPSGTSGRSTGRPYAHELNETGIYSVVRHPLYLGNYFMWIGVMMLSRTLWLPLPVTLAFWLYYERICYAEEALLQDRFGERFEAWAAVTPAFFPALDRWVSPSESFSAMTALRRERSGAFGLVAAFALADTLEETWVRGRLAIDPMWLVAFLVAALLFTILRTLQHRTKLLDAAR